MHKIHFGLTVTVAVKPGRGDDLRRILRENNQVASNDLQNNFYHAGHNGNAATPIPAKVMQASTQQQHRICNFDVSDTTLSVTGVIIPSQIYCDVVLPQTFVFATTYCGSLHAHLLDLAQACGPALCGIFRHCNDFPDSTLISNEDLICYLQAHSKSGAFNSRYSCISKSDVKHEKELRDNIENYLDELLKKKTDPDFFRGNKGMEIKKLVKKHVTGQVELMNNIRGSTRLNFYEWLVTNRVPVVTVFSIVVSLGLFAFADSLNIGRVRSLVLGIMIISFMALTAPIWKEILLAIFINPIVNHIARKKNLTAARPPDNLVRTAAASQLRPIINEMTAAAPLKAGIVRRNFYSLALKAVNFGRHELMKIPTVSNIRWLAIDNKRRLLFLSTYANTTDFYVREFLTGSTPKGVNFMFTNGCGFPDAERLTIGGISKDPEGYMNVVHHHQHVTDLWYSHEPNLTIDQILRNRKIRKGLFKKMNEADAKKWLRLF